MSKQLGNHLWGVLESLAMAYPETPDAKESAKMRRSLQAFTGLLDTTDCSCGLDWRRIQLHSPPTLESHQAFNRWLTVVHDFINHKLDKPLYSKDSATDPIFLHLMQKIPQRKLELGSAAGCLKCG